MELQRVQTFACSGAIMLIPLRNIFQGNHSQQIKLTFYFLLYFYLILLTYLLANSAFSVLLNRCC